MNPQEVGICHALASALLADTVLNVAMLVLYGPLIILFLCSIYLYRNSATKRGLILISSICFVLATVETIVCIRFQSTIIASLNVKSGDDPLVDRSGPIGAKLLPSSLLMNTAYHVMLLFNDGVMVWRACVLHNRRKKVTIPLTTLLVMDIIATLWYTIEDGLWIFDSRPQARNTSRLEVASPLVQTLSLAVEASATCLIGYMLKQHMSRLAFLRWKKSRPHKVLLLVVESGIFLCICQFLILILSSIKGFKTAKGYRGNAMGDTSNVIVMILCIYLAIYPNLIILFARFPSDSFIESSTTPLTEITQSTDGSDG